MRILIGFNGSEASNDAICDLHNAGLGDEVEALVLTVAEQNYNGTIEEAGLISKTGVSRIREEFPNWKVTGETCSGSPAREILARSETFRPDLIVVGEPRHELSTHNMFIGRTSHVLLTEAECSVRISRGSPKAALHPQKIIVGFDGSAGAKLSVDAIARRHWPSNTAVQLLAVADSSVLDLIGRFTPQMHGPAVETKLASQWAETLASNSLNKLKKAGISSSVEVCLGHAKEVIIEEAERTNADTIFVGPHCSANSFERFLIGSVSASVAARAHCSVEVVRSSPN